MRLFAQGTFHVTDQIDVIAGARETWTTNSASITRLPASSALTEFRTRSNKPLGRELNYRPADRILSYAKVSTGSFPAVNWAAWRFDPKPLFPMR